MSKRPNAGRRGAATDRAPGGTTIGKSGTEPSARESDGQRPSSYHCGRAAYDA
jgi:hypothetical protein